MEQYSGKAQFDTIDHIHHYRTLSPILSKSSCCQLFSLPTRDIVRTYLYQVISIHRNNAEPQNAMAKSPAREASRELEQSHSKGSLGQTLSQQSPARADDDHDVHPIVPFWRYESCCIFNRNEDVVG